MKVIGGAPISVTDTPSLKEAAMRTPASLATAVFLAASFAAAPLVVSAPPAAAQSATEAQLANAVQTLKALSRSTAPRAPQGTLNGIGFRAALSLMDRLTSTERNRLLIRLDDYRDLKLPGDIASAVRARAHVRRLAPNR